MQILLTEEEHAALMARAEMGDKAPSVEDLQALCTLVADNVVLTEGWRKGRVWGCILTKKTESYCDDCPARKLCPYPYKRWSK